MKNFATDTALASQAEELASAAENLGRAHDAVMDLEDALDQCGVVLGIAHGLPLDPHCVHNALHGSVLVECAGLLGDARAMRLRIHHLAPALAALRGDSGAGDGASASPDHGPGVDSVS